MCYLQLFIWVNKKIPSALDMISLKEEVSSTSKDSSTYKPINKNVLNSHQTGNNIRSKNYLKTN